jgi:hypothetical protein
VSRAQHRHSHVLSDLAAMRGRRRAPGLLVTFARVLLVAFLLALALPYCGAAR